MGSLGFFAYPEASPIVAQAVTGAVELSTDEPLSFLRNLPMARKVEISRAFGMLL
jgi:hypothetical protein